MAKNTRRSMLLPITVSIISTIGVFAVAEYVFHIPSRFFDDTTPNTIQISENQNRDNLVSSGTREEIATSTGQNSLQTDEFTTLNPSGGASVSGSISTGVTAGTGKSTTSVQSTSKTNDTSCTLEYAPVCGADGRTYSNTCMANRAKTIVAYDGDCKTQATTETTKPTVVAIATGGTLVFDTGSYQIYTNASYSFALPKYVYYAGFGAQGGASHTVAIGLTSSGTDAFATADVRVYFFRSAPANPPEGRQVPVTNGVLYISGDASNAKIAKIIDTISASAK